MLANETSVASINEREAARVAGDVAAARGAREAAVSEEAHQRMSRAWLSSPCVNRADRDANTSS